MCSSGADRSSTTVLSSPFPPTVSNCAFLFILVFCQVVKTFTAHFELYFVFLGTVSDSKAISSTSVFGERKRPVAILTVYQWLKIINYCPVLSLLWDLWYFDMHVQWPNRIKICIQFVVSFHKYDKIFASDLYGLYNGSPSARHCKRPYRSPAHILSTTPNRTRIYQNIFKNYSGIPLYGHPDIADSFVCANAEKLIHFL